MRKDVSVTKYTFIKAPTVILIAETATVANKNLGKVLKRRGADLKGTEDTIQSLFPEEVGFPSDGEELAKFAGKHCYNAFGKNGSKRSTKEYLEKTVYTTNADNPYGHLSICYHPHFTFYVSGISKRISQEWQRHHIGTAYSQISARYCVHPPRFVVPPKYLDGFDFTSQDPPLGADAALVEVMQKSHDDYVVFKKAMKSAYRHYLKQVKDAEGKKGMEKKRTLEAAAAILPSCVETAMVVTFNPISAAKFIKERTAGTADLEMQRVATKVRDVLEERYQAFKFR
jgi:thymidylate synthase (FAD)